MERVLLTEDGKRPTEYLLRWENRSVNRSGVSVPGLEIHWNPGTNLTPGPNNSNLF